MDRRSDAPPTSSARDGECCRSNRRGRRPRHRDGHETAGPPPRPPPAGHSLSRATPSAGPGRFSELIGFPISRSFPASCVRLEPRPLPSTGVTQLPRYYGPLRHPIAPVPSLTGVRLLIAGHAMGLPVLRALSSVYMLPPLPRCSRRAPTSLKLARPYQPSPKWVSGRPAHRPFRGLLSVHSRCGLHTRTVTLCDRHPGASDISSPPCLPRLLPAGALRRVGLAPTGKRRLRTAHPTARSRCAAVVLAVR